jgi:hypothetical protein
MKFDVGRFCNGGFRDSCRSPGTVNGSETQEATVGWAYN